MAIAPIAGTMKRKIVIDISVGITIGTILGTGWWSVHKNMINTRETYYAALAEKKKIEEDA